MPCGLRKSCGGQGIRGQTPLSDLTPCVRSSLSEIGQAVGFYSIISRIVNRQDSDHARKKT